MKIRRLYRVRAFAACLAGALALTACGGDDPVTEETTAPDAGTATDEPTGEASPGEQETTADLALDEPQSITMVLPFGYLIGFAPSLVAETAGYFDDYNLDVTIQTAGGSSQAVQQVLGGQALLSRTGGPDLIAAVANADAPIVSVGTVSQRSPFEVISSGSDPVESPDDFAGETIGVVSAGGATEYLLNIMVREAGLDPEQVEMEVVGNAPGAFSLVEEGAIAAFIATSGTRSNLEFNDADIHYFSTDEYAPLPGQAYVVAADDVEANGEVITAFLAGVQDALHFMLEEDENFDQTLEYLSEWEIAALENLEQARAELEVQSQDWVAEDGTILLNRPEAWQEAVDLMADAGIIEEAPAPESLYTNQYVEQVLE